MTKRLKNLGLLMAVPAFFVGLLSFSHPEKGWKKHYNFPYKQAGLSERAAAAHLLNRLTFGATPGEVDDVVKQGLENWFEQQLSANQADDSLNAMLAKYNALGLTNAQVVNEYPRQGAVVKMAVKEGLINKDSIKNDKKEFRTWVQAYLLQKGFKPEQELYRQFVCQKILRAAYSNNQLQEVLTDFWFNHFNVSITKNDCAQFIPAYERDVIRPNALGKFDNLLLATAKSPAMLVYLDNFSSAGADTTKQKLPLKKNNQGLNENYAREVMELHTLGVDGGYTQQDVTQAARVLTGWTVYPMDTTGFGSGIRRLLDRIGEDNLEKRGFVHDGDFLFTPNRHDKGEKTVLNRKFASNGGYQEGVDLLEMLAAHPSTAKFITKKIAVRFVSDNPPQSLLDRMAKTFREKNGDIKEVLTTMVSSPEFWAAPAVREKTKSPFELAISTVRSLHANITLPYQLYTWITKMGQKFYYYQAPTGFPDKGQYWINTGSLLNRMNFGLAIASQRIPGISFNLAALNNNHEPESAAAGLVTYGKLLMPERNLGQTVKLLTPMLSEPDLFSKVNAAAATTPAATTTQTNEQATDGEQMMAANKKEPTKGTKPLNDTQTLPGNNTMLAQIVGILIGSPEFQRR